MWGVCSSHHIGNLLQCRFPATRDSDLASLNGGPEILILTTAPCGSDAGDL